MGAVSAWYFSRRAAGFFGVIFTLSPGRDVRRWWIEGHVVDGASLRIARHPLFDPRLSRHQPRSARPHREQDPLRSWQTPVLLPADASAEIHQHETRLGIILRDTFDGHTDDNAIGEGWPRSWRSSSWPSSVPALTAALSMSPVEMWGI